MIHPKNFSSLSMSVDQIFIFPVCGGFADDAKYILSGRLISSLIVRLLDDLELVKSI